MLPKTVRASIFFFVALPLLAQGASNNDWTVYTTKLVGGLLKDAKENGVVFRNGFQVRIGIHPSRDPGIFGGLAGAPDFLIVTEGFIALAKERQLGEKDYKVILAHELGHMVLGHKPASGESDLHPAGDEFAADEFARERLGRDGACLLADALHRLQPKGGWRSGSLEGRRERLNAAACKEASLKPKPK